VSSIDIFELELRKLDRVAGVGFSGGGEDLTVHLMVPEPDDVPIVGSQAEELARLYLDRTVSVVVLPLGPVPAPPPPPPEVRLRAVEGEGVVAPSGGRVSSGALPGGGATAPTSAPTSRRAALLGVHLAPGGAEIEVHVGRAGEQAIGRGAAGQPAAAAQATIDALGRLGWDIPFQVRSAVRLALGIEGAVVVSLSGPGGGRMGIGQGAFPEEAAAKATLQALNRYVDDVRRIPPAREPR
jgi:hypothetical protein